MPASKVMNPKPMVLRSTDTIGKAARLAMDKRYRNMPVVDDDGCYLGVMGVHHLLALLLPDAVIMDKGLGSVPFVHSSLGEMRRKLEHIRDEPVTRCLGQCDTVAPDTPLMETLLILYRTRTSIPVVDPDSGRLEGLISFWDVGDVVLGLSSEDSVVRE
ncbi:MAG: HPP family protein [Gammaproteobacteria bacterium]